MEQDFTIKNRFLLYIDNTAKTFRINANYQLENFGKWVIIIFLVILPILFSLIRFFLFEYDVALTDDAKVAIVEADVYASKIVFPSVAMIYCLWRYLFKSWNRKMLGVFLWTSVYYILQTILDSIVNAITSSYTTADLILDIFLVLYGFLVIFFYFYKNQKLKQMWLQIWSHQRQFLNLVIIVAFSVALYYLLSWIFTSIESGYNSGSTSDNQQRIESNLSSATGIIYIFISTLILAPILEELSIRMVLQEILNNKWYSVICSAIFFAFLHIRGGTTLTAPDYYHFLTYLPLGLVNGFVYYYFKNIIPCMMTHFLVNFFAFIYMIINNL